MPIDLLSNSEHDTLAIGEAIGRIARAGDIIALHGELGSGKTRLIRGIARGMGIDPSQVSSPTFVVVHEYTPPGANEDATPLVHVDAYRLRGDEELDTLGWDRVIDGSAVVAIEWAERVAGGIADAHRGQRLDIHLTTTGPDQRRLGIEASPAWWARPGSAAVIGRFVAGPPGAVPPGWTRCPVSGRPVPPDSPTFPFADERCRLADLGRWLGGGYRISRDIAPDDLDDPGIQSAP